MDRVMRAVPVVAVVLFLGVAGAGDPAAEVEAEIQERLSWDVPLFVPDQPACADLKTCTQTCRSAALNIRGGSELWPAGHACEVMGDMWADGRAHKKGKTYPEAGMRSWYSGCYYGNVHACEKEAAYFEANPGEATSAGWGEGIGMAFAIRASTCIKGHTPACLAAADMVGRYALPFESEPMYAWYHVPACDERGEAASCAWADAHPEIAKKYRDERAIARQYEAEVGVQSNAAKEPSVDVAALKATHRPLWTAYPYDWAPSVVTENTGHVAIYHCYEVWIPQGSADDAAIQATVVEARQRYDHTIDPKVVTLDRKNPRTQLQMTPCWGRTRKIVVP